MKTLLLSATAFAILSGCSLIPPPTPAVSETEKTLCEVWRESLPTRSRSDTEQTFAEIGEGYDAFEAACRMEAF